MPDRDDTGSGLRLDVESLRVLRSVVASGSFTAAGDELGLTQSAVSHKIRRLEERIGATVLLRDGTEVVATDDGRELLEYAELMIQAHDAAVERLRRRSDVTGTVRLGVNEEVAATELAEIASHFRRTHPGVQLAIRVHDSATVAGWVATDAVDLALIQVMDVGDRVRPDDVVRRRDRLHIVQGAEVDLHHLEPVPLISFGPSCLYEPFLTEALDSLGLRHHRILECPSIEGVRAAVRAGLGVAVLNTPHVDESMRSWGPPIDLPEVAFVLRSSTDLCSTPAIALRDHLLAHRERLAA